MMVISDSNLKINNLFGNSCLFCSVIYCSVSIVGVTFDDE